MVLRISRNLWEDLVDTCFNDESSVWDCYPQATPRTPVDLDDEATEGHGGVENGLSHVSHSVFTRLLTRLYIHLDVDEPLVCARMMDTDKSFATSTSTATDVRSAESTTESAGSSRGASSRAPRLRPTTAWKKSIDALISGGGRKATRSIPTPTSGISVAPTSADVIAPAISSELDWSEDVEEAFFSPCEAEMDGMKGNERISGAPGRVFEKCGCALETAHFEPESWNKFKIPASCHPRPPIHFFAPRDVDKSNPSTRIVIDNVNAFRHHSTEPNVPYVNKDIEDLFYPVGAKNVRSFDGRIVGGVLRYSTSYAVVDFETVEDAKAAFKMFQGRKAYPGSFHLRLKFVDVNDRTFGRRMAVSMGPMERSEEEREAFVEFIGDLDRVDIDLARVVMPSRPGFTLPPRPVTPSE